MSVEEHYLDELLGAYALDAVSEDERRAVDEYLQVNPRARQEVADHRDVATMLAWTGMRAPDGLWDRIVARLDDAAVAPAPTGELADVLSLRPHVQRAAGPGRGASKPSRVRRIAPWVGAAAAAAVIGVVAVAVVGPTRSPSSPLAAAVDEARADTGSRTAELAGADGSVVGEVVVDSAGHGFLVATSLPALGDDRTYQLWGVIGERVISLGVLGAEPEIGVFSAGADVTRLVLTNEVAGGVATDGNPDGAFAAALG